MFGIGASRIADECLDRLLAQQAPDERFRSCPLPVLQIGLDIQ